MQEENMKSLAKTFDILEMFLHGKNEYSVTEVSKILNLNKATVSRIMIKLANRGYLQQVEKRGKYSLGYIFLEYSGIIKSKLQIRKLAMPYLVKLSQQAHESVIMAVVNRDGRVFTETFHDTTQPNQILSVVVDEGASMPLHSTGLGKIILAGMSEDQLDHYFEKHSLDRYTPNTVTDRDSLKEQLKLVRQEGVAFDDQEYSHGVRSVAAGLVNSEGKLIGAIGILAPSLRLSKARMRELIPVTKSYALEISTQLGYRKN